MSDGTPLRYPPSVDASGRQRRIVCHLFGDHKHHSHQYIRGDVRVICPGRHDSAGDYISVKPSRRSAPSGPLGTPEASG